VNLLLSAEQEEARRAIATFLGRHPARSGAEPAIAPGAPAAFWSDLAGAGWLSVGLSEAAGGGGGSVVDEIVVHREFGRYLTPGPTVGTTIAAALLPEAGDERFSAVLSGQTPIGVGVRPPSAGQLTGFDLGSSGLAVRLDDGSARLVQFDQGSAQRLECIDDSVSACTAPFAVFGATAAGPAATWARGACLIAAQLAGIAEATLARSVAYAKDRVQFGVPIGSFQAVKHRCADMAVRAEEAWSLTALAALLTRDGDPASAELAAAAALTAAEAGLENAWHNIQNHGGIGFTSELGADRFLRRAHVLAAMLGTPRARMAALVDP
jgi:alkylation response protein AidB-like acyl-CoA dehydrogenase